MKKTLLASLALMLFNWAHAQQFSGIYFSEEDYQKNRYMNTDVFISHAWTPQAGYNIQFSKNGVAYKLNPDSVWGYMDDFGAKYRICKIEGVTVPLMILKDAPLCVYGFIFSIKTEDKEGNLTGISCPKFTTPMFFLSETISEDVYLLTEASLVKTIEDDPLYDDVLEEKYGKAKNVKLLTVINVYNKKHDKKQFNSEVGKTNELISK